MNSQIDELLQSFESKTKSSKHRYNEFLAHVYATFEKYISSCNSGKKMNKYKEMRAKILKYILANEKSIILNLSK